MDRQGHPPRRIVLIDFDWQDADHLPGLMRMPRVSIRLIAGASPEDAGVRMASLCGLPRSMELADLTREIFDIAVVGERSPRREQLERLMRALGTPIEAPQQFMRRGHHEQCRTAFAKQQQAGDGYPLDTVLHAHDEPCLDLAARTAGEQGAFATPVPVPVPLPVPEVRLGRERTLTVLEPAVFTHRLQLAVQRHHVEGFRFALYRLVFDGPEAAVSALLDELPDRLRGSDCVCRPASDELLQLCGGSGSACRQVRRRIEFLWRQVWAARGESGIARPPREERIDLASAPGASEAHDFTALAGDDGGEVQPLRDAHGGE